MISTTGVGDGNTITTSKTECWPIFVIGLLLVTALRNRVHFSLDLMLKFLPMLNAFWVLSLQSWCGVSSVHCDKRRESITPGSVRIYTLNK